MPSSSTAFQALSEEILKAFHDFHPTMAVALGFHQYDGKLPDWRPAAIAGWVDTVHQFQHQLTEIDTSALDAEQHLDHIVLSLALQEEVFGWEELRDWQRNPMVYSNYCDVSGYLKRDYAPFEDRFRGLIRHLRAVPAFLETGWSNIARPVPETFVATAMEMFKGHIRFLSETLPAQWDALADEDLRAEGQQARDLAHTAITRMLDRLKNELLPEATQDFAIGTDHYSKMLRFGEMVDMPLEQLVRLGEQDLARNEQAFVAVAAQIEPDKPPREVLATLAGHHPTAQSLISDTRATLDELAQFIRAHEIVTIPSDTPCIVAETPPFLRWAFAMLDSPGAFEEKATEAFYYVTPVEDDWTAQQKEEWLRKFDYYTLRDVSAHEAYPGHYVHYLHYRQTPSDVRKTFGAYSFWEGWAHYIEEMMLEEGYGDGDPRLHLAQLSEALVRNCRYLVSIRLHTAGMTVDEATQFFVKHAYMDELPARKEAERGTFDPGYLNYTLGKLILRKLRADYTQKQEQSGKTFSLGAFHDQFLSYGAPPIPLVRQQMLDDHALFPTG